jgi:hypothetical protein
MEAASSLSGNTVGEVKSSVSDQHREDVLIFASLFIVASVFGAMLIAGVLAVRISSRRGAEADSEAGMDDYRENMPGGKSRLTPPSWEDRRLPPSVGGSARPT